MKILMVHNDYGKYSGEEAVVDQLIADGRRAGYDIETLRRTSKFARLSLLGNIHGFFSGLYSLSGVRMMREALRSFQPDIVHIHNLYPFISPAALFECKKAGVPVIMTVHNYRLICPTGLFLRDGRPCESCLQRGNERDCIRYNCEGSRFKSFGYALRNAVARRTGAYRKCVDYYCCLTEFQKQKLIQAGFDANKIYVFHNYIVQHRDIEFSAPMDAPTPAPYVGFVGRLSHEKGYDLLLEVARRHPDIPFQFAGQIRDDERPQPLPNVRYRGLLYEGELYDFYEQARFIVLPSRIYEGFPIVLLEALSHSKPCIVPNHGCYPELIQTDGKPSGLLFEPLSVDSLESTLLTLWNHPEQIQAYGQNARHSFDHRFNKRTMNLKWDAFLHQVAGK